MDLAKMIAELQEERHRLDEAIEALERLSAGQTRRRGRPPRSSTDTENPVPLEETRSDSIPSKVKKMVDRNQ